jgi:Ni,Fe-hydrogenase III large subunit
MVKEKKEYDFPLGPYHPALAEPANFTLKVRGEEIRDVDFAIGYNHRGIEMLIQGMDWRKAHLLVERICGICSQVHINCFVNALEKITGIEVPLRAKYLRVFLLELERLHNHLLWLGVYAYQAGFKTEFMHIYTVREVVMRILERLTGYRLHHNADTLGGVQFDVSEEEKKKILYEFRLFEKGMKEVYENFVSNTTLIKRMEGVGILPKQDAIRYGVVGPVARASGIKVDLRKDDPYEVYKDLDFKVVYDNKGDCMARALIRWGELFEALHICRQVLDNLPPAEDLVCHLNPDKSGEAFARVEAMRGELIHYLVWKDGKVVRDRIRTPTYANIIGLRKMLPGAQLADAPVIIYSIDPCFGCLDRFAVVDENGKKETRVVRGFGGAGH